MGREGRDYMSKAKPPRIAVMESKSRCQKVREDERAIPVGQESYPEFLSAGGK